MRHLCRVVFFCFFDFFGESHILPQLWTRLIFISSNYCTDILRLCLAMGAHFPWLKGRNKPVYRLGSTDMSVARCDSPARGLLVLVRRQQPSSVGTMSAPTSSVCGHAAPCWAESINPSIHAATVTYTLTLTVRTNQRSRAAKAHLVNDWKLTVRHTTAIISAGIRRYMADVFSQFRLLPAHCLVGQLSHSVELLLHLVCFCVTTGRSSHFTYLIDRMKSDLRADLRQTTRFSS